MMLASVCTSVRDYVRQASTNSTQHRLLETGAALTFTIECRPVDNDLRVF
jgi:hypothetical protein